MKSWLISLTLTLVFLPLIVRALDPYGPGGRYYTNVAVRITTVRTTTITARASTTIPTTTAAPTTTAVAAILTQTSESPPDVPSSTDSDSSQTDQTDDTSSSTLPAKNDQAIVATSSGTFTDDLYYKTGALVAVLFIGVIATLVYCLRRQNSIVSKRESSAKSKASESTTATSYSSDTNVSATGKSLPSSLPSTLTQNASLTTWMRSTFELSLPGYLMYELGGDGFRMGKKIAQGGGGIVFIGEAVADGLRVCGSKIIVKLVGHDLNRTLSELTEREQAQFRQEVSIMHFFREEKYIAKLLGWSQTPACILMKFYAHGSLDGWIDGNSVKNKNFLLAFMLDISNGISAMHRVGFVHCDIKPQNVLVDSDAYGHLYCCLTDFGITQVVDESTLLVKDYQVSTVKGLSTHYAAPEMFQRFRNKVTVTGVPGGVVTKVDVYALGVILLELLTRRPPWQ